MTQDADHRMSLRFAADDLAWITEQAADEGVDNATMVRMIVNRLRRGRAPLISMMEPVRQMAAPIASYEPPDYNELAGDEVAGAAEDVLAARLAELGDASGGQVVNFQPQAEAAAMPIRRVERERYNPGRK